MRTHPGMGIRSEEVYDGVMPATQERMTAEQYLALPVQPNGRWRELIEGEVVVNEPTWLHGTVRGGLHAALWNWVHSAPERGAVNDPIDVLIDDRNVFAPDSVWYRDGRVPGLYDARPYGMPDLVAEVRSPSTWRFDIGAKKAAYERHGLRELWLVDTAASVLLVFRRSTPKRPDFDDALELTRGDMLRSPQLRGFELALDELFG